MMSHMLKVVSLAVTVLLAAGAMALAAPPQPGVSPHQPSLPQINPCIIGPCPDLVPWKGGGGGGIGVKNFGCSDAEKGKVLKITLGIKNIGTAKTTAAVKTLAKVNGVVWNNPNNPHTTNAPVWPGQWQEFHMNGPVPGPGTYTLEVKVDSENAQLEKKENNNVATATTTCN